MKVEKIRNRKNLGKENKRKGIRREIEKREIGKKGNRRKKKEVIENKKENIKRLIEGSKK